MESVHTGNSRAQYKWGSDSTDIPVCSPVAGPNPTAPMQIGGNLPCGVEPGCLAPVLSSQLGASQGADKWAWGQIAPGDARKSNDKQRLIPDCQLQASPVCELHLQEIKQQPA